MKLNRKKQKGMMLIGLMAGLNIALVTMAGSMALWAYEINKGQVYEAIGRGWGLADGASAYARLNAGVPPANTAIFSPNHPLVGSRYASYQIKGGHILVTLGDTMHGAQNPVTKIVQDAVIDFAPNYNDDGSVSYTCSVDNSFLKQLYMITQCGLTPPPAQTQTTSS